MNEPTESAAGHEGIETLLATQTKDIIDGIRRRCHRCDGTGEEEIRDGQLIECEKCKGYGMTELNELAAALCKAQAEIEGASKDSTNPFFKSNYADLASIWTACRGPLTKHGLSVVQLPGRFADGCVEVTTMLLHESGQSITSTISTPVPQATNKKGEVIAPADPQIVGSAITYLRRYSLAAMVGVAPRGAQRHLSE